MPKTYLDFEQPLEELDNQLEQFQKKLEETQDETTRQQLVQQIHELQKKIEETSQKIYQNLTPWQRVQLSRHPNRPQTLFYIQHVFESFFELQGDRCGFNDHAMITGIAQLAEFTVALIGQQKGTTTKERQRRNFGMNNPEGYRKALRTMKLAEKFGFPVITLIDTPGAFPGIEAEERGQAYAIARNLYEMAKLRVPILCVIIGEGASGGALGIGVGDRLLALENTWFSVISPESCSSILWRSWDYKAQAAEALKLTPHYLKNYRIVDEIIPEPIGGAHRNPLATAQTLRNTLIKHLNELVQIPIDQLLNQRLNRYRQMGAYLEGDQLYASFPTELIPATPHNNNSNGTQPPQSQQ